MPREALKLDPAAAAVVAETGFSDDLRVEIAPRPAKVLVAGYFNNAHDPGAAVFYVPGNVYDIINVDSYNPQADSVVVAGRKLEWAGVIAEDQFVPLDQADTGGETRRNSIVADKVNGHFVPEMAIFDNGRVFWDPGIVSSADTEEFPHHGIKEFLTGKIGKRYLGELVTSHVRRGGHEIG